MIKYTPANQLTLEGFEHPFDQHLDKENRWVKLAALVPWDELARVYCKNLSDDSGRESVDARCVIAALIVKHKLKLSDREAVQTISENIYLQYFCGYASFSIKPPFDASLFVDIRKRMGVAEFDAFHEIIVEASQSVRPKDKNKGRGKDNSKDGSSGTTKEAPTHRGKLKIDATVCDQHITYPTDLGLLNSCREESERIIDWLYAPLKGKIKKPRTYRRKACKQYLNLVKKKKPAKKAIWKAIRQQLQYVKRNISHIHRLLDEHYPHHFPFNKSRWRDLKLFWVMQHIYEQQKYMYDQRVHSCPNRIVSLYQPYVRPIVRGKKKAKVEFGAKINVSEVEGMAKVEQLSWEAYNEAGYLEQCVENYKNRYGYYPEVVLVDSLYLNRKNRNYLKQKGIHHVGKPLGRPPKKKMTAYQKRKRKKLQAERNHIEAKFGTAKNGYSLNKIRAARQDTSESWIMAIFFILALDKYAQWAEIAKKLSNFNPINWINGILQRFRRSFLANDINLVVSS